MGRRRKGRKSRRKRKRERQKKRRELERLGQERLPQEAPAIRENAAARRIRIGSGAPRASDPAPRRLSVPRARISVDARELPAETTCPLCRDAVEPVEGELAPVRCSGCQTIYHQACLVELGGCSTMGCGLLPHRHQEEVTAQPTGRYRVSVWHRLLAAVLSVGFFAIGFDTFYPLPFAQLAALVLFTALFYFVMLLLLPRRRS